MSRDRIGARIVPGSAFDALADGPAATAWGLTQRLHDMTQRYALLLAQQPHTLPADQVKVVAEGLNGVARPWPMFSGPILRLFLAGLLPVASRTQDALATQSHAQLISLVEDAEDLLARRITGQ